MWGRSPPPTPPARVPSTEGNIQEQSDVLVAESALLSARMIGFSKKQHEERRLICLSGTGILIVAMGNVIDVEQKTYRRNRQERHAHNDQHSKFIMDVTLAISSDRHTDNLQSRRRGMFLVTGSHCPQT
jgi:hypothetical protein